MFGTVSRPVGFLCSLRCGKKNRTLDKGIYQDSLISRVNSSSTYRRMMHTGMQPGWSERRKDRSFSPPRCKKSVTDWSDLCLMPPWTISEDRTKQPVNSWTEIITDLSWIIPSDTGTRKRWSLEERLQHANSSPIHSIKRVYTYTDSM